MVDADADVHRFLIPEETDPVAATIRVREFLDDLPPTRASFSVKDLYEDTDEDPMNSRWFKADILRLCGSWRLPDYYPNSPGNGYRWVNPNYAHRERFSDVAAQCECGTVIQQMPNGSPTAQFMDEEGHAEDCRVEWRAHAVGDLYEARREVLRRNALLGLSSRAQHDRFHVDSPRKVVYAAQTLDIDVRSLKDRGMEKRLNTMIELIRRGYPTKEVGAVYDIQQNTVRSLIAQRHDETISEIRGQA